MNLWKVSSTSGALIQQACKFLSPAGVGSSQSLKLMCMGATLILVEV
ncbi:MAG: hypothetical protein GY941_07510 [Planctomycetes bacterium]|nr:hypothetical protein [Planctomycetota bacterium]